MKQFSYKGYVVEQFDLTHEVVIKKDGRLEFHGQYTRELSEFELYKVVDDYIKISSEKPTTYDEALAQYLMDLATSKNHIVLTMHSLNNKPFDEQLKDMYENRYVKLVVLKNEDAFLSREEAERDLQNEH